MNTYINSLTRYLLAQSWQIALLAAIVALISLILRNRSAHIRYLLWLIVLAKCIVPTVYSVRVPVLPERPLIERLPRPSTPETQVMDVAVKADVPIEIGSAAEPQEAKLALPSLKETVVFVWSLGAFLFLVWISIRAVRYTLWLRSRRSPLPDHLRQILQELLKGLKLKKLPRIWLTQDIGQPFVWGLFQGSVYLPVDFLALDDPERCRTILAHELSHVARFDAAINLLQVLAQAVYWFHPVVWWTNRRIRQEREKCCDEMTVVQLDTLPEHYTSVIVDALAAERRSAHPIPSLAIVGSLKDIEERIKTMLRPGKKFYKYPPLAAATVVMLMALLTVPTALVLTARAQPPAPPESAGNRVESLDAAIAMNNISEVKRLIAGGADVNAKNEVGFTPLSMGINMQGERIKEVAELLIDAGANVNARGGPKGREGRAPLHWATFSIHKGSEIVRLLVDRGANLNLTAEEGWTPLHFAVNNENLEAVRLLIDKGADFNLKNQEGWTAFSGAALRGRTDMTELFLRKGIDTSSLHMAAFTGNLSRVKELVKTGTDVNVKDEFEWTALFWAACAGQTEVAKFLIENKADLVAQDGRGQSLLHQAARTRADAVKFAELLIAKGADVNAKNARGDTPLHLACYSNVAELLIAKGADVAAKNRSGYTPLHNAASANHLEVAELLISKGAAVDAKSETAGSTPLLDAVIPGNTDMVRLLIDKGADVNVNTRAGSPLHLAVMGGHADIAELLIAKGANVNARDRRGATPLDRAEVGGNNEIIALLRKHGAKGNAGAPEELTSTKTLHEAAADGDIEQVRKFIDEGVDLNTFAKVDKSPSARRLREVTPLAVAALEDHSEIVKAFLDAGADVDKGGSSGYSPLLIASMAGKAQRVKVLISGGANVNLTPEKEDTALNYAIWNDTSDIVRYLLDAGADAEQKDLSGESPLQNALSMGNPDIVKLLENSDDKVPALHRAALKGDLEGMKRLIAEGAGINDKDEFERTPIEYALAAGQSDTTKFLLDQGVDINLKTHTLGRPILHQAARAGMLDIVQILIEKGADLDTVSRNGGTVLHNAIWGGHKEIAELLISKGVKLDSKDRAGCTPLFIAADVGNIDIVELLIAQGADVNARNRTGSTPLLHAVSQGKLSSVEKLISGGADVNVKNNRGQTPLDIAIDRGYTEIVELLKEHGAEE